MRNRIKKGTCLYLLNYISGRYRMIVGFTTTYESVPSTTDVRISYNIM